MFLNVSFMETMTQNKKCLKSTPRKIASPGKNVVTYHVVAEETWFIVVLFLEEDIFTTVCRYLRRVAGDILFIIPR